MVLTEHSELNAWIDEMAKMCQPDDIVLIDGSEEQKQHLTDEACKTGEIIKLNQEILPGCVYHRTAVKGVEVGAGFAVKDMTGHQCNDQMRSHYQYQ